VNLLPGPPIPGTPPLAVNPASPTGARLPAPVGTSPSILPPPQFTKLPESTYPENKPPLKPVESVPPAGVTDLPPILPPQDVGPLLTGNPKPVDSVKVPEPVPPGPVVKPLLTEAPRPTPGEDGFSAGPRVPPGPPEPILVLPPTRETNSLPPLPLKPGDKHGHGSDYKWIAGVVDRHLKGGYWTIRYADIGTDDLWGGKVRLLDDERLRDFRNGDVVYIEGELMAPKSAAEGSAYPPFRVTAVRMVEKAR
jgi:hypothetical protein